VSAPAPTPARRVFIALSPPVELAQALTGLTRPLAGLPLRVYPAEDLH
jgi:2'-5' RNA ligase